MKTWQTILAAALLTAGAWACGGGNNDPGVDGDLDNETTSEAETVEETVQCFTDLNVGEAVVFNQADLQGCEGIAFDGLGGLFVSSNHMVLKFAADGSFTKAADIPYAIGMAFDAAGDLVVADFGESFSAGDQDGVMFRIDSAGVVHTLNDGGMSNPNFVTRTPWGTYLISDDMAPEIWEMTDDGQMALWCDQVPSPNGMVFDSSGTVLYVAVTFDDSSPIYRITVADGKPGQVALFVNLDDLKSRNDGMAMDRDGNLYVAANGKGKIVKVTPGGQKTVVAESDLLTPASIAFGRGPGFDPCSIYVTELLGYRVWRISLGVAGMPLYY